MSEIKSNLKTWIDCNVNDGECRKGCKDDRITFTPDDLYELIDDMWEDEIKDLERRLEEAREFAEEMLDNGYFESSIGLSYVKRLEQLKEKGGE